MASLSKENKKGYRIQWRFVVRVGPRANETVAGSLLLGRCTRAAAKAQLRDTENWEEAVKTGRHLPDTSWEEVTGSWLDERELTYTQQTLARATRVLSLYERWRREKGLPVKTIDQFARRVDLIAWRNHRLEQEAGRKTVANDLSTLAELFRWCVREKYLPDNPIDRITRPRFTIKKEGTPLTREQAGRWLWSIRQKPGQGARGPLTWEDVRRKRQIAVFLLNTGVRNGELCALDIDDLRIDEEAQLLHVFGKGLKHRWVPLNRAAQAAARLHLHSRDNPKSGPLFVTRAGKRYNVRQLVSELRKSTNACDEDLQVNAHNLRHTFATGSMPFLVEIANGTMGSGHLFEAVFQVRLQRGSQAGQLPVPAHLA
ncbi:MAG: tyrosine-type recombinase/integrase [bacterium]|nr:tyrosine-type recombinase/integrase [bacterium]